MRVAKSINKSLDVALEDLLGRKQTDLDRKLVREKIQGKVVMVTGAAGSIGSELCRQIASFNPLALVGFDQAETPLFHLEGELQKTFPDLAFHAELGSITQFDDVDWAMSRYRPSIVYHSAAYKHVPILEKHPFAAVDNNIFGTWKVAQSAVRHGAECFVLISSDKAVRPSSIMGVTKRVAELLVRAIEQSCATKFVSVRFGNVLGSSGSVVPIFEEQIAAGGPVTVTHPEMQRYFMTGAEAGQLVLQAFVLGSGGETFVLDMGEPIKILDLARNLIRLSGLEPGREIEIRFSGVRPGEKLFEEVNFQAEHLAPTAHPRVRSLVSSEDVDATEFEAGLKELQNAVHARDAKRTIQLLKKMVPEYNPVPQLIEEGTPAQAIGSVKQSNEPLGYSIADF
jgi:FlaA1/EpsC-like NDP-sugar epimerase